MTMNDRVTPGKIEDLKAASDNKVSLTLVRKDFTGKIIEGLKLTGAIFAKNIFVNAKIYNCKFDNCGFTKDDFSNASLAIIDFKGCQFYNVNFSNSVLNNVTFDENCKFYGCTFDNIDMSKNVAGLTIEDKKIINEQTEEQKKVFEDCGFVKQEDGTYKCDIENGKYAVIYHDSEMNEETWRMSFYSDNECYYTVDFDLDERLTQSYLTEVYKYGLATLNKKIKKAE